MWPTHCVQGSAGADFAPALARAPGDVVVRKGAARLVDSYSGFGDAAGNAHERTALEGALRAAGATHLVVVGLALDWCVSATCRDAARLGFPAFVVLEGCRGIDAGGRVASELAALRGLGVVVVERAEELPGALFARA